MHSVFCKAASARLDLLLSQAAGSRLKITLHLRVPLNQSYSAKRAKLQIPSRSVLTKKTWGERHAQINQSGRAVGRDAFVRSRSSRRRIAAGDAAQPAGRL